MMLVLLITLYLNYFGDLFAVVIKPLGGIDIINPDNFWWHILDGVLWGVRQILFVLFFLITLILVFVAVFLLASLVNAPFYETMAEKILVLHGKRADRPFVFKEFVSEVLHSLKIEAIKISFYLIVSATLFVLSLIPGIGIVFTVIGLIFTAWFFAFEVSAFALILEKASVKELFVWGNKNKMMFLGFGLLSLVPFLGLIMYQFQVVGGTLLYIENTES